jgi:xanthine dehydrogenase accessory factor
VQEAVFAAVLRALDRGEPAALVTIVSTLGSTPQRVGAKMLVYSDGRTVGTIGGGCYESDACGKARDAIGTRKASVVRYDLSDDLAGEHGLICGGRMEVFIEPLDPTPHLYIIGAGHIGQHLARVAHLAGFRVHVVDDRVKFSNTDRFPDAVEVLVEEIPAWVGSADIPPGAYVVVVTRGHRDDFEAMRALGGRECRYIGMIGSRAKVHKITTALEDAGVDRGWLGRIHAPIGFRIGAVTPEEIAISIAAELIAVRRGAVNDAETAALAMRLPARE